MTAVQPRVDAERVGHPWRLVAPWWHWPKAEGATPEARRSVRTSAPVLQKYDGPDFVNTVLADPQRRLAFLETSDRVARVTPGSGLRMPTRTPTTLRKLFLATHHRHYLVVCGLHCDRPGFPRVADRTQVCETGFVVRRRTLAVAPTDRADADKALRRYALARRRRAGAEAQLAAAQAGGTAHAVRDAALLSRWQACQAIEEKARDEVAAWAQKVAAARALEGWKPHGLDQTKNPPVAVPLPPCRDPGGPAPLAGVGGWAHVSELPENLDEATFPLFPLVADPRLHEHDAAGQTLFFGVVPTGSSDIDDAGTARFDDRGTYEIRCFVRRHRPACPRDGRHCRCPITWSEPTEPYQLASHFDLEGCANKPVTVQMPDRAQLQADAFRLSPGGTGGVRFAQPPGSLPFTAKGVDATPETSAKSQEARICSFSIPLITIVAFFVFSLFLPIVIFVFQLWWMLLLKFCIEPEIEVDAALDAALDALPPGVDADFGAKVDTFLTAHGNQLDTAVKDATGRYTHRDGKTMAASIDRNQFDNPSWVAFGRGLLAKKAHPPTDRVFAERVERSQVVAP